MNSPFDDAKYQALLNGLTISEVRLSEILKDEVTIRLDAEHYKPEYFLFFQRVRNYRRLADFVLEGYRVIYENTEILNIENIKKDNYTRFIQASDIITPEINLDTVGYVDNSDWERYPKGRVKHGEILIEVKGKAEKVAIVSNNIPLKSLVSGSLFKLSVNDQILKEYLVTYLICKYGKGFRERCKTNLLISFINKQDLYNIPVPVFSMEFQRLIQQLFQTIEINSNISTQSYKQAEQLLLAELGLTNWQPAPQKSVVRTFAEAQHANRLDAEYFQPKYQTVIECLSKNYSIEEIGTWGKVLKGRSVEYVEDGRGIPVIRSGDLIDLDHEEHFKQGVYGQPFFYLQKGDVCISSIGFGSIGKVQVFDKEGQYATVSEVTVIRQKRVNPYYLQVFLQSIAGQLQIEKWITGATGQLHLYPRDVEKIAVPILPQEKQELFEQMILNSRCAKEKAKSLLECAKRAVEIAIEQDEQAALAWLERSAALPR